VFKARHFAPLVWKSACEPIVAQVSADTARGGPSGDLLIRAQALALLGDAILVKWARSLEQSGACIEVAMLKLPSPGAWLEPWNQDMDCAGGNH
jgi:hypothetical protein